MNKHTPEPWVAVRNTAYWEIGTEIDGYYAARIGDVCATDPNHPDAGKQEANANRIVACVNACKGINPEAVPELLRYAELEEEYREAANSRDHKQKLHEMRRRHGVDDETPIPHWIAGIRSSAIAKAKGVANV